MKNPHKDQIPLFNLDQYERTNLHPDAEDWENNAREHAREHSNNAREHAIEHLKNAREQTLESAQPTKTCSLASESVAESRSLAFSKSDNRIKRSPSGWVEIYSPSNRSSFYYRYCFLNGRTPQYTHIRGGNINSPEAQQKKAEIEEAIANERPPSEIVQLC